MKILFFMTHPGHTRNFESTLRLLISHGHSVHVVLDRGEKPDQPEVGALLDALVSELEGLTREVLPRRAKTSWSEVGVRLRSASDYLRYVDPAYEPLVRLRRRAGERVPRLFRRVTASGPLARPTAVRLLQQAAAIADESVPASPDVESLIERCGADVVLVTPLVELGSPQTEYVRCARVLGISVGLLVASWDNLTVKGSIRTELDQVVVWNDVQRREAVELHGVRPDRVVVTGAAAYDQWFDRVPGVGRDEFCSRVGLDPGRPFILYVGSSDFVAPREGEFVENWIKGLRRGRRRALEDAQVLVRPHPANPMLYAEKALSRLGGVALYPREGRDPTDGPSRADYFHSLHFSSVVVGVNTSALIEAAIVGRPVHTILVPAYGEMQGHARHFGYLVKEDALRVARSFGEHEEQLESSLLTTGEAATRNGRFLESFVRPNGLERSVTPQVVEAVEALGDAVLLPSGPLRPRTHSAGGAALALGARAYLRHAVRRSRREKYARSQNGERSGTRVGARTTK